MKFDDVDMNEVRERLKAAGRLPAEELGKQWRGGLADVEAVERFSSKSDSYVPQAVERQERAAQGRHSKREKKTHQERLAYNREYERTQRLIERQKAQKRCAVDGCDRLISPHATWCKKHAYMARNEKRKAEKCTDSSS